MLQVAPAMLESGLSAAALVVRGTDNRGMPAALVSYRRSLSRALADFWKSRSISAHPAVAEYHRLHQLVGVTGEPPAPEKLILHLRRHRDLVTISAAVDCYNLVSARTLLALGAHDLSNLATPVSLRRTTAADRFRPLGNSAEQPLSGEYAYVDARGQVICRLEVLQCEGTKVTRDSRDIVFFLQGNRFLPAALVLKGVWLLAEMVETFCGGVAELVSFVEAAAAGPVAGERPPVSLETFQRANLCVGSIRSAEPLPRLPGLARVSVRLDRDVDALAPASVVGTGAAGRRGLLADGLHPLGAGGQTFSAYLLSAGPTEALRVESAVPDGARLY